MNAEKAIAVLRIHTSSRGSSLATLNRELLRARFNKVVQQRTKLEPGLDVKRYQSMTDQRHVYESEAIDCDKFVPSSVHSNEAPLMFQCSRTRPSNI